MLRYFLGVLLIAAAFFALWASGVVAAPCAWHEPRRTYPEGIQWDCVAARITDGDTFQARCAGQPGTVAVRVRGLDVAERGDPRWSDARQELRRRIEMRPLIVAPHHQSYNRVVADVFAGGENVGARMDAAGWSKDDCPKR